MARVIINGIEIPKVKMIEKSYVFLGQRKHTASGKLRQDMGERGYKKKYTISTQWLSRTEVENILSNLESIAFGDSEVWLDDFGGDGSNTVTCIIPPENITIANMEGFIDRRSLTFEILEK